MSRQWAAAEATAYGWGGVRAVSRARSACRRTPSARGYPNWRGVRRTRTPRSRPGFAAREEAGRPARGWIPSWRWPWSRWSIRRRAAIDLESPLRWTCIRARRGNWPRSWPGKAIPPATSTVGRLLERPPATACKATARPGRAAATRTAMPNSSTSTQRSRRSRNAGQPVISVDTPRRKELVGDFKNGGREWRPQGEPEEVRVHDFMDKGLGKAIPYGVYDVTGNQGWVSVGRRPRHRARFATEAIRRWWRKMWGRGGIGVRRLPSS